MNVLCILLPLLSPRNFLNEVIMVYNISACFPSMFFPTWYLEIAHELMQLVAFIHSFSQAIVLHESLDKSNNLVEEKERHAGFKIEILWNFYFSFLAEQDFFSTEFLLNSALHTEGYCTILEINFGAILWYHHNF